MGECHRVASRRSRGSSRAASRGTQESSPNKRLRNTLIGLAAGVGLGVALDQTVGRFLRNESSGDGGRALTYTLPVAGGALLGAFIPAEEAVYRPKSLPGSGKNSLKSGP
ncbi:MAG TPA: hypothetical protein VN610_06270 [Bryobacteraceae bacterium]|nr:hypothetical protein [Bryobacteraceae bacterium]